MNLQWYSGCPTIPRGCGRVTPAEFEKARRQTRAGFFFSKPTAPLHPVQQTEGRRGRPWGRYPRTTIQPACGSVGRSSVWIHVGLARPIAALIYHPPFRFGGTATVASFVGRWLPAHGQYLWCTAFLANRVVRDLRELLCTFVRRRFIHVLARRRAPNNRGLVERFYGAFIPRRTRFDPSIRNQFPEATWTKPAPQTKPC